MRLPRDNLLRLVCYIGFVAATSSKSAKQNPVRQRLRNRDPGNNVGSRHDVTTGFDEHLSGDVSSRRVAIPDEQRLMRHLLANYDSASRPVYNAGHTVVVKFGLTLAQIADMDEVNQVLTTIVWFEQEWQDERLKWNPAEYNNLSIIRIPCQRIWLPDIVLYNSADDFTAGLMQSKAMVSNTGTVFWPPPAKLRSSCKIDITYFPFDDQKCRMKFGSWTYDGFQVDVQNRSAEVDLANYVFSGEWQLLSITVKRNEVYYACCREPYPDVTFTIVIRRRTLYYLFNIIFPCLWLTVLSLLGFWLPPDSGEKITLGITVLLAFSVFMLMIAENMPATSEFVPLMGIYLTITMGMTSLSIILTVFVLQLYHVTPRQRPVPPWLRHFMFECVANALRMRTDVDGYRSCALADVFNANDTCKVVDSPARQPAQQATPNDRKCFIETVSYRQMAPPGELSANGIVCQPSSASRNASGDRRGRCGLPTDAGCVDGVRTASNRDRGKTADGVRPMTATGLVEIALVTSRPTTAGDADDNRGIVMTEEELRRHIGNEWKLVALIMDRLLFLLFLIISTLSTFGILVVHPLTKPSIVE